MFEVKHENLNFFFKHENQSYHEVNQNKVKLREDTFPTNLLHFGIPEKVDRGPSKNPI